MAKTTFISFYPLHLCWFCLQVIMIADDILPVKAIKERYHAWKEWPQNERKNKRLTGCFQQFVSTGIQILVLFRANTYSQNLYKERRNNYNFWPIEDSYAG